MKKQNLALSYLQSISATSLKITEKEALIELIENHKALRENAVVRCECRSNLPKWKRFIAKKLGLY